MRSLNPNFKARVEDRMARNHFMHFIGFEITDIQSGRIVGVLNMHETLTQQDGFVHGGVTATICDIVSGFASYSLIRADQRVVTVDLNVSYYRAGTGKKLTAIGEVAKAGGKFQFCKAQLFDQDDLSKPIAESTATMAVLEALS